MRGMAARGGFRRRARVARERPLDRVEHVLVDRARIAEPHFDLRRMHVHVDGFGRQIEEQHVRRIAVAVQHVLVGRAHRVRQQLVAHEAAVHEEILLVGAPAARGRQAGAAVDGERAGLLVERQVRGREAVAEDLRDALRGLGRIPVLDGLAVVQHRDRDVRPRERRAADHFQAVAEFGLLALQELAPRGRVEVQLSHLDRRADRAGGGRQHARLRIDLHRMHGIGRPARDRHLGDRRDRRERFTAKTQRRDRLELLERADLAGRMAHQRERQFVGRNPAAVVGDRDALDAAFFQHDAQRRRAGVHRVFEQLLDDRRRAFDDLAGGDLADQLVGQGLDRAQRARGGGRARRPRPFR